MQYFCSSRYERPSHEDKEMYENMSEKFMREFKNLSTGTGYAKLYHQYYGHFPHMVQMMVDDKICERWNA